MILANLKKQEEHRLKHRRTRQEAMAKWKGDLGGSFVKWDRCKGLNNIKPGDIVPGAKTWEELGEKTAGFVMSAGKGVTFYYLVVVDGPTPGAFTQICSVYKEYALALVTPSPERRPFMNGSLDLKQLAESGQTFAKKPVEMRGTTSTRVDKSGKAAKKRNVGDWTVGTFLHVCYKEGGKTTYTGWVRIVKVEYLSFEQHSPGPAPPAGKKKKGRNKKRKKDWKRQQAKRKKAAAEKEQEEQGQV